MSLLPQTTNEAPLVFINSSAALSIPAFTLASAIDGAETAPPNLANNARATAPVSEGL